MPCGTRVETVRKAWLAALALAGAPLAVAEVTSVNDHGFGVSHSQTTPANAQDTWAALSGDISQWWDGAHSWSGNANNLYLDIKPGGCFCERLPEGGWVEHLRIVYLAPGQEIRFRGALGPLMTLGLEGTMTWRLEPVDEGTKISFNYIVSGHREAGFEGLAPAVDNVIGQQLDGLVLSLAR